MRGIPTRGGGSDLRVHEGRQVAVQLPEGLYFKLGQTGQPCGVDRSVRQESLEPGALPERHHGWLYHERRGPGSVERQVVEVAVDGTVRGQSPPKVAIGGPSE